MSYKTILVHVDYGPRCKERINVAIDLARAFDAHLVGVHALTAEPLPSYLHSEGGVELRQAFDRARKALTSESETLFRSTIETAGYAKAEFRSSNDDAVDALALNARYADLVVAGQSKEDEESGVTVAFVPQMLLSVGRPVLMVPYVGTYRAPQKRILVAWNGSREATRAVTDALPLLERAAEVDIVVFNPTRHAHGDVPGADIALYLARHGVNARVSQEKANDIDVGNLLLSRAADLDANLIVMGAYGHSRVAELVLGGVTRTLLESMTVPVLMSH